MPIVGALSDKFGRKKLLVAGATLLAIGAGVDHVEAFGLVEVELNGAQLPLAPDGVALVTVFEALHDANDPARVLESLAGALEPHGAILIGDEKVADEFTPGGDFLERLNYGFSVLHCLPATVAEGDGEANGTVMRAPVLARWVEEAGLSGPDILPIDNELWRFYRVGRH